MGSTFGISTSSWDSIYASLVPNLPVFVFLFSLVLSKCHTESCNQDCDHVYCGYRCVGGCGLSILLYCREKCTWYVLSGNLGTHVWTSVETTGP